MIATSDVAKHDFKHLLFLDFEHQVWYSLLSSVKNSNLIALENHYKQEVKLIANNLFIFQYIICLLLKDILNHEPLCHLQT